MEHFASAADGWVFFPLTSGTWVGSRFSAGRTRTVAEVRLTHRRSAPVLLSRPPVFCRRRAKQLWTSAAATAEGGNCSGCARGGRAGLAGRCRRWAHPWTKRGENSSADQLQKSHRAAARVVIPQIATTTVNRWPRVSIKSPQLSTEHCTCLLTLALSQPLAARSFSSSKSITSRYCGTSCHPM